MIKYMQGDINSKDPIDKINYEEIILLLPHIEKFVLDLGNNFCILQEKFHLVEKVMRNRKINSSQRL